MFRSLQLFILIGFALVYGTCCTDAYAQSTTVLSADEFEKKLLATSDGQLVDVRTRGEFSQRRLKDAMNVDYNSSEFESLLSHLDKNKPTFVYCLSGGRSASAVDIMRKKGFQEIYELKGGIMQWQSMNKPLEELTKTSDATKGMTEEEFTQMLKVNKLVLVDFGASWCPPCRKLEPILEKISKELSDQVSIIGVDIDKNPGLAKQKNIEALPVLMLYKDQKLVWQHNGFLDETGLREIIQTQLARSAKKP